MAESDSTATLTLSSSGVCSSSFKMKPVQLTYPAASVTHQQPRQYRDCEGECKHSCKCHDFPYLPAEMCLSVLSFLEAQDLILLSTINHLWSNCCKDESLWKGLFSKNPDAQVYFKIKDSSWYETGVWLLQCLGTEFDDGARKKDGKGRYTFINGESYFGEWKDSKFNGFGVCSWPDGRRYTGMFKEGKRFGYGIFTWPSGCKYEGEWEDDRRHGKGKDTWPDSSSFCGEYKQDKFDGYGHFQWEDGGQYEGHWKEDHRHGFGEHKWKDGRIFKGEFANDRFLGDKFEE